MQTRRSGEEAGEEEQTETKNKKKKVSFGGVLVVAWLTTIAFYNV